MVDYLNLTPGEQKVKEDGDAAHERECEDCEPKVWAEERCWGELPTIVCLCGSTRFYDSFMEANYSETMKGKIVLSVGWCPDCRSSDHSEGCGCDANEKKLVDELHMRKIDLADEVLILNVGGYIGASTGNELAYAEDHGKRIRFLEPQ